jgi:hypothetical protein
MKRTSLLLTASVVLVVAIFAFSFFGCSCWKTKLAMEGFEVEKPVVPVKPAMPAKPVDPKAPLTPQEKELFEDLKNNRLSEDDIKTLVNNNVLNEKLVEKFLDKLADASEMDSTLEGFTSVGNTYACATFGADQ